MKAYASSNVRAQPLPARNWLLFNIWFSLLVIWTSAAATLRIPISRVAWPLLIFSGSLVVFLAFRLRSTRQTWVVNWARIFFSILILGVALVVLQGCLIRGEFVSVFPDAWAYTAFATYVQNQVPVIDNGLQPILSFGQHLMGARYGTAGLLALFAEISGTDACRVAGVYAFLMLVQSGLGFALLARSYGAGRNLSLGAGLFAVSIGWVPEIIKIGNWDQVLFLSFIPFILLRSRFLTFQTSGKSGIIGLGICLAAAAFAYPEGAAMAGVIYLPLAIWRLLRGRDLRGKLGRLAIAAAVTILFSGVYLPTFTSWLYMQVLRGTTLDVGKNAFVGLSSAQWLPAIYGLGEQPPLTTVSPLELIVPILFLGLTLVAVRTWWRKRDGILLTIPVFFLLVLWQAVLLKYNYGFYKILTMFWPVMVMAIFSGMSSLLATMRGWSQLIAVVGFNVLMAGAVFNEQANLRYSPWGGKREIKPFLELAKLKEYSENSPIGLVTQSWFNQMWAVFFCRAYNWRLPSH